MGTDAGWQALVTSPIGGGLSQAAALPLAFLYTGRSNLRPADSEQLLEFPGKIIHPFADFRGLFEQRG